MESFYGKWPLNKAWEWYNNQPWMLGFNYVPCTAVNSTEMWQKESFDPETIEGELGWAAGLGYNSCRVFLQYIVWKNDPEGLKDRIDSFLSIADRNGISSVFILFDDCRFADDDPFPGKQPDPIPGVHNSRWTPSPGFSLADDENEQPMLEKYVKDIVSSFSQDRRIIIWDLYNEPGNCGRREKSTKLLMNAFRWAREVNPSQPLTSGVWNLGNMSEPELKALELSDIINFHCYMNARDTRTEALKFKELGRPLICTEWLHRPNGNTFEALLEWFKGEAIGVYNWGLVCGKTQTNLSWETMGGKPDPNPVLWQQDVLYSDGRPYSEEEAELLKKLSPRSR